MMDIFEGIRPQVDKRYEGPGSGGTKLPFGKIFAARV